MLVQKLKPWVSSFSAAIAKKAKHGDMVTIGGQIKAIYDITNLFKGSFEEDDPGILIVVDDAVGQVGVIMPAEAYQTCRRDYDLKEGMVILAEGRVDCPEDVSHREGDVDVRVICWKVYPIPQPQEADRG